MMPSCLRLDPAELKAALASLLRADSTWQNNTRGFHILNEEPDLYNKWLYTIPDANGNHRLLGLSRRFCPITNHPYAGYSLYHPDLPTLHPLDLGTALRTVVLEFLRLPRTWTRMKGILRGLVEGPNPSQRAQFEEWSSEGPLDFKLLEEDMEESAVDEERSRVSWHGKTGPVWEGGSQGTVEVGGEQTIEAICKMQNDLNLQLRDKLDRFQVPDPAEMDRGIRAIAECHARHGYLTVFSRGAFLISRCSGHITGCVWCFRSFHPKRAGWTIWLRRPYIDEEYRGRGVFPTLARAALGIFAEAGYPTRVRRFCSKEAPDRPLLGELVTSRMNDSYPEFNYYQE
jgi:hypothetical protein